MFSPEDTIVAIGTPLGEGGLGVVRLSGPQAIPIADRVFRSSKKLTDAPSHTLHHGWVLDIDETVAAVFRAPRSYTGDDVVEFSCHGSPLALREVVRACEANGARHAQPGEFTQRAYINGKLDLAQAEAVAGLIHAQSSRSRAAALAQLRGGFSNRVAAIRARWVDLLAHVEANLDFAEEEIPIVARDKAQRELETIENDLADLLATKDRGRFLREGARVALAGRPNVGKSSLFNALLTYDRAIVTDVPGTTRDTLEETLEWNGFPIALVDTAGLRDTGDAVERLGTDRAKQAHAAADAVIAVLDGSRPLDGADEKILNEHPREKIVVAVNKSDLAQKMSLTDPRLAGRAAVTVSAKTGAGLAALKEKIAERLGTSAPETGNTVVVTNLRHVELLETARARAAQALAALRANRSEESVAVDLRAGLEQLGMITGESVAEDVLSSIFRQFCIGK